MWRGVESEVYGLHATSAVGCWNRLQVEVGDHASEGAWSPRDLKAQTCSDYLKTSLHKNLHKSKQIETNLNKS